jgi:hypothetical protein
MSRVLRSLYALGLTLGLLGLWSGADRFAAAPDPERSGSGQDVRAKARRRILPTAQKTAKKEGRIRKGMTKRDEMAEPSEKEKTETPAPEDRDKAVEKVGLDRWKKGNSKYNPAEKGFRIDNLLPFWRFLGPEGDRTPSFHLESSVSPCVAANLP